jgi:hypothetical protein
MRIGSIGGEKDATSGGAVRDPVGYRILDQIGRVHAQQRGRGPTLDEIVDLMIQGPISRRASQGRAGVEVRLRQLVDAGHLRLDRWGAYHLTAVGWTEGLDRSAEDFAWH